MSSDTWSKVAGVRRGGMLSVWQGLLDGIEVRTVGREEADLGPRAFNGGANGRLLMHHQVVESKTM